MNIWTPTRGASPGFVWYPCFSYSGRTKCIAEKLALSANCAALRICAVRPAGIYGEGEQRHFSRIVKVVNQGLY